MFGVAVGSTAMVCAESSAVPVDHSHLSGKLVGVEESWSLLVMGDADASHTARPGISGWCVRSPATTQRTLLWWFQHLSEGSYGGRWDVTTTRTYTVGNYAWAPRAGTRPSAVRVST